MDQLSGDALMERRAISDELDKHVKGANIVRFEKPNLAFFPVDNKNRKGALEPLRKAIYATAQDLSKEQDLVPIAFGKAYDKLQEEKPKHYISYSDMQALLQSCCEGLDDPIPHVIR